jgi:protoporphyrinogen oxidase
MKPILIIGAGCAGLAAAYRLAQENRDILLVERSGRIGGLAETFSYRGIRFDLGPHVFFKEDEKISTLWRDLLKDKFIKHRRRSSLYYNGQFIHSPLNPLDALLKLGPLQIGRIWASYLHSRLKSGVPIYNSRDWVVAHFGERLYEMFYKGYNEKIWGVDCEQIELLWPERRIKSSLLRMMWGAFLKDPRFTVKEFDYPEQGASMMHEAFLAEILRHPTASLKTQSEVTGVVHDSEGVSAVDLQERDSRKVNRVEVNALISSMPIDDLVRKLDPPAPSQVLEAANELHYRNLITVNVIADRQHLKNFRQHWIDIHAREIRMLRVTNFGNLSEAMCTRGSVGLTAEYVCSPGDEVWTMPDKTLIDLAGQELEAMKLLPAQGAEDGFVLRKEKAYAVCLLGHHEKIEILRKYLERFRNLQTIGRQGMFLYNNMHHSVRTGLLAAENLLGSTHDLWALAPSVGLG